MNDHRRQLEEQSVQLMQVQQRLRETEAASYVRAAFLALLPPVE